jgi:hypothetical protein
MVGKAGMNPAMRDQFPLIHHQLTHSVMVSFIPWPLVTPKSNQVYKKAQYYIMDYRRRYFKFHACMVQRTSFSFEAHVNALSCFGKFTTLLDGMLFKKSYYEYCTI